MGILKVVLIGIFRAGQWYAHVLVRLLHVNHTPATMLSINAGNSGPRSDQEVTMEEAASDDTTRDRPVLGEPIRGASTATDEEDEDLVYDRTRFWRDKVRRRYFCYYHGCQIIMEGGVVVEEFDERAPRVRAVLDAQCWTDMVKDHRPTIEEIVWEFYANLYQRCGNSFYTWIRGRRIKVTSSFINLMSGVPSVCDPTYPYSVDHLPTRAEMVACFVEGRLHQMEFDGEGSFQMSDFSNDVHCIYHILVSRVLSVISHTLITIERSRCLYAMLTEAPIDFGSVVTSTMMYVRLLDKGFALPYGTLITRITLHSRVDATGLKEIQLEKGPMGACFLNTS